MGPRILTLYRKYEYKCDVLPNSGVQFRSNAYAIETVSGAEGKKKLVPAGRVPGYLEEIDPNNWDRMWRGGVIHRKAD